MSAPLPIVASDTGGMNEIVIHEKNGLLFPLNEPKKLAECIRHLISHPEARNSYFGEHFQL